MEHTVLSRKVIWILIVSLIVFSSLAWGFHSLSEPSFLPIKEVKIAGNYQHIDQATLKNIIMPFAKKGFFATNIYELKQELLKLSWVNKAEVSLLWPDTLVVNLQEQQPQAIWNNNGLINQDEEVYKPDYVSIPRNLPVLNGPEGMQKDMLKTYHIMATLLTPINLHIAHLDLSSRNAWSVYLNNGTLVELGRDEPQKKLAKLVEAYPKIFTKEDVTPIDIDMRYPNGMAIQLREQPIKSTKGT